MNVTKGKLNKTNPVKVCPISPIGRPLKKYSKSGAILPNTSAEKLIYLLFLENGSMAAG